MIPLSGAASPAGTLAFAMHPARAYCNFILSASTSPGVSPSLLVIGLVSGRISH
jgi:hypothetical protein